MTHDWLTSEVIRSVTEHMNDDHRADTLTMIKPHLPDAVSATVAGLDQYAMHIIATDARGFDQLVALPWPSPLQCREDIRRNVIWLYQRAVFPNQRCEKHSQPEMNRPENNPTATAMKEERS